MRRQFNVAAAADRRGERATQIGVALLAVWAVVLCWQGISWAIRPGFYLFADELGNLPWLMETTYSRIFSLFPNTVYNDRPMGQALERFLYECFGFDYTRQLVCFLVLHFVNCGVVFLLFRRLGVSLPLSVAGVGVFGSLSTTAITATYIGASYDVLCTLFLLGSMLAILYEKPWCRYVSALLFLLALRSKEFAIVGPVLMTALVAATGAEPSALRRVTMAFRKLWLHYAILLAIGLRYLSFVPVMRAAFGPQHPYYLDARFSTVFQSLFYYTALVVGVENTALAWLPVTGLAAMLVYGIMRRDGIVLTAIAGYVLTLMPVSMLPNIRSSYYVYGPQIFLILSCCVCLQRLAAARPAWARTGAIAAAVLLLASASAFRMSAYFGYRTTWYTSIRHTCARTAQDAQIQLASIGRGSHVYLNNGKETPWLLTVGPCSFLQLMRRDTSISCVTGRPEQELLRLYRADIAEKYLVDYHSDGSLSVRARGTAPAPGRL